MIPHLDLVTLIFILIMGHAVSLLLLFADMWRKKNSQYDRILIVGRVCQLIAWILISQRGSIADFLSLMIGNTFLMIGHSFEAVAMASLKVSIMRVVHWGYGLLLGVILLCWWNIFFDLSVETRIVITLPLMGLIFLIPGCLLLFSRKRTSLLQKLIGVLYVIYFSGALWRTWYTKSLQNYTIFLPDLPHTASFFVLIFLLIVSSLGYILIKKEYANIEMEIMANTDFLSGLYNRRAFFQSVEKNLLAIEEGSDISLLTMDIDSFKSINDCYGHLIGDMVIKQIALTLQIGCRDYDIISRFGGDEFVMFLPGTNNKEAEEVAERLRRSVEGIRVDGHSDLRLTVSIGGATLKADKTNLGVLDALVGLSDRALYCAKEAGRNQVVV